MFGVVVVFVVGLGCEGGRDEGMKGFDGYFRPDPSRVGSC